MTSLCCLIFWTGWGFCSHFLWSSDITLMWRCLGEQGCGRGDGQTPRGPKQLKVEEGWCSLHAFGCFQRCVGCFAGKCWQKVPGEVQGGTGSNGESGGMQGEVQWRGHGSKSYCPSKGWGTVPTPQAKETAPFLTTMSCTWPAKSTHEDTGSSSYFQDACQK